MMRTFHSTLLIISLALATGSANAQEACYDFQTGNITFRGVQGDLGLTIFAPEEALRRSEAKNIGGGNTDVDVGLLNGSISWANFGGFPAGELDAGNIIVRGTNPDLLSFKRQLSFTTATFPMPVKVINLPEPGALSLAISCAVGLIGASRFRTPTRNY